MSFEYLDIVDISNKATKLLRDNQYEAASTLFQKTAPYIGEESLIFKMNFYGKLGQAYLGQELFEAAIKYTKTGVDLSNVDITDEEIVKLRAKLQLSLVSIYKEKQNYEEALATLKDILEEGKNQKDTTYLHALHFTADIYSKIGQLAKASSYYKETLFLAQELKDECVSYTANSNLGIVYKEQKNYQAALSCYQQALLYLNKENISYEKAKLLLNIGIIHRELNDWDKAMQCYEQALKVDDAWKKGPSALPLIQKSIGVVHLHQGNLAEAATYLYKVLEVAKDLDNDELLLSILFNLYKLHQQKKEFEQALHYMEQYQILQEEIHNRNCSKQLARAEESHRVIKERIEKDLLKQQKERIKTLLHDLHHRIKNDFQSINSMMGHHLAQSEEEPAIKSIMQEVCNRTQAMSFLHQALYQEDKITINNLTNYLPQIVSHLCYSYQKSITKHILIEEEEILAKKARPIGLIVNELVSNVLKYAFPNHWRGEPTIWVTVEKTTQTNLQVVIKDNGVGVPKGMDWRKPKSTGLLLVGFWLEDLRATMQLISNPSMGTCWIIDIPVSE